MCSTSTHTVFPVLCVQGTRGWKGIEPATATQQWEGAWGGLQPWDRPQAPQERGEGGAQLWDRPLALRGEGGG